MTSYRPVDSKREEFRKYLEKAGAMDALTKVLVMLYDEPEKPTDALDYIRKHLGDNNTPNDAELSVLKSDLEEARLKIQSLEDEVKMLKERLAQYEPPEPAGEEEEGAEDGDPSQVKSVAGVEGEGTPIEGNASAADPSANASVANPSVANPSTANVSAAGSQPAPAE